jgi:photosystem II stability/assembly factor-like uncharacterized protein
MMRTSLVALALLVVSVAASSSARVRALPAKPDIQFVNASVGWVSAGGKVFATLNGGRSWRRELSAPGLIGVDAVDTEHAWALTTSALFATSDGGRSWTRHGLPAAATWIDFADPNTGWAVNRRGSLFATGDGGASWREVQAPKSIDAICLSGPTRAFAAAKGTVFSTTDGGGTWARSLRARSPGGPWWPALQCSGSGVWALFVDGVAAGSQGYAAYSAPDGMHWRLVLGQFLSRRVPRLSSYAGPFSVISPSRAFFVGFCPACNRGTSIVARTRDGGRHWRRSRPELDGFWPEAASFVDRRNGFLATLDQRKGRVVVWRTRDAGRSWSRVLRVRQ